MPQLFRRTRRLFHRAVYAAVMLAAFAPELAAEQVLIVLSGDDKPYQQANAAARYALHEAGHDVTTLDLADVADQPRADDGPDVLLAVGTRAAVQLSRERADDQRLAYCMVAGPHQYKLSRRPNEAGITTDIPVGARLQLLREGLPDARSLGALYRSDEPSSVASMDQLKAALPASLRLHAVAVDEHDTFADAMEALFSQSIDVVWTEADRHVYESTTIRALLLKSLRHRVPVFGFSIPIVRAGAVLGVGTTPDQQGEQAARLVEDMIAGRDVFADESDDVNDPDRTGRIIRPEYQTGVNLIVAEQLEIRIPDRVIRQADQIFKREEDR